MPFTPAHAAIVLPLIRRQKFSATGLIVGTMAPDFEYFFKMSVSSEYSHTLAGLFYFDIPVVILLSLIFHTLVKRNLILNLPSFLQRRFLPTMHLDFVPYLRRHWGIFLCSAALGAASHVVWDSFTHSSGYFVQELPFYHAIKIPYNGVRYPLFYALQHISTFTGLFIILVYIVCMPPAPAAVARPKVLYWVLLAIITGASVWIRYSVHPENMHIGNRVVSTISGLCLGVMIAGFVNFKNTMLTQRHGEEENTMGTGRKTEGRAV